MMRCPTSFLQSGVACIAFCFLISCAAPVQRRAEDPLDKALHFLQSIQNENGAICDSLNPLFDVWETVMAARALSLSKDSASMRAFSAALGFLKSNENADGTICHNQKCKGAVCLETTAMYVRLGDASGEKKKHPQLQDSLRAWQDAEGYWNIRNPDVREAPHFPSVTAFVINMLDEEMRKGNAVKTAMDWLIRMQKEKGDWGTTWEYYGSPAYALWPAMEVLAQDSMAEGNAAFHKALNFIRQTQAADGSWDFPNENAHHVSKELHTALILNALIEGKKLADAEMIRKALTFLLKSQRSDGSWDGGLFPIPTESYKKQEYVFTTSLAAIALHQLSEYLPEAK